jgi:ABC-2 type transport system ATP-binding protein
MIHVADLRKSYGSLVAVDGVSFEVAKGETFGLLGPNGAGKTTTLHMVIGALKPDAGSIRIDGELDPTQESVRRRIGLTPQALALYEELTAEENLRFFGSLYGLAGAALRERVAWALALSELTERRKDRVKTYSGGMKRRLNLACGLIHDPSVVLLDEPTVGVDPQSRNHVFDSIEKLAKEGLTILFTTHYMEEAQRLCDRVAIMDRGKILALDTVENLIAAHGGLSHLEAELAAPPGDGGQLSGQLDGNRYAVQTARPLDTLTELAARGYAPTSFKVASPDLEAVFLNLTGRRLRD